MALTSENNDLRLLDPRALRIRRDAFNRLHLEIGIEERYSPVRVLRCLPLTRPGEFIAVQDEEGTELGIIASVAELEPESRKAVEEELELYYLKARVLKIHHVEARNGLITWELETDRGPRKVHVRDRQHIRPLPDGRTMLTDIHEARFDIPQAAELDEASRHWLEIEL